MICWNLVRWPEMLSSERGLLLLVLLLAAASAASAQQGDSDRYQLVLVRRPTSAQLALIGRTDSDHIRRVPGGYEIALTFRDVAGLRDEGLDIVVLIDDLERFYSDRAAADIDELRRTRPGFLEHPSPRVPDFRFGSVAGFYNPDELARELTRMRARFPGLAGAPFPIGRSVEGQEILAIRLSARSEADSSVPEVLFTALQHAREPIGMMSVIHTAWELLDGYGSDPQATYLLDHRALYLVPLVNPDGYLYNLRRFPQGGGLSRKNMRIGGGVDLNRNYGPREFWEDGSAGSSDRPGEITYRGPEPFSEPETRAIRDFCLTHSFRVALNFHSFSNLLIYPFDWVRRIPADSTLYRVASRELTLDNGYAPGPGLIGVGYPSRGIADEWMYAYGRPGDRIMSWAPELGSEADGFWPRIGRIMPLVQENDAMSLGAIWLAGSQPRIVSVDRIDTAGAAALRVVVQNVGRDAMDAGATVAIQRDSSAAPLALPPLAPLESRVLLLPVPRAGSVARPELRIVILYHGVPLVRIVRPIVRPVRTLFSEDFDVGLDRWRTTGWEVERIEGRGNVLTDSPEGDYHEAELPSAVTLREPVSLRGASAADLRFDARWVVEAKEHDARIQVRRVGDTVWSTLDVDYLQVPYDSASTDRSHFRGDSHEWHTYSASLDRFLGQDIVIRFVIVTPRTPFRATFDGVMIDDLSVGASFDSDDRSVRDGEERSGR
jgi:hypothetical protein